MGSAPAAVAKSSAQSRAAEAQNQGGANNELKVRVQREVDEKLSGAESRGRMLQELYMKIHQNSPDTPKHADQIEVLCAEVNRFITGAREIMQAHQAQLEQNTPPDQLAQLRQEMNLLSHRREQVAQVANQALQTARQTKASLGQGGSNAQQQPPQPQQFGGPPSGAIPKGAGQGGKMGGKGGGKMSGMMGANRFSPF